MILIIGGICLKETSAKIVSSIIAHRLLAILKIHVRSGKQKSKMEAMFFPITLKKAKKQNAMDLPDIMLNNGTNNIHFTHTFKYLGSIRS